MSWFTSLVPLPYRWLILAGLFASTFGYGYVKGLNHEKDILDAFKASIQAQGQVQAAKVTATINQQKAITEGAKNEANDLRTRLAKYYAGRVLPVNPSPGTVPAIPGTASGVNATAGQSEIDTAGVVAADSAAQDALSLLLLQNWVRKQQDAFHNH